MASIFVKILKQRSSYFNLNYLDFPVNTQHPLYGYFQHEGIIHMLTFIHSLSSRAENCIVKYVLKLFDFDYNLQYFRMM